MKITCTLSEWLSKGPVLVSILPIDEVELSDARPQLDPDGAYWYSPAPKIVSDSHGPASYSSLEEAEKSISDMAIYYAKSLKSPTFGKFFAIIRQRITEQFPEDECPYTNNFFENDFVDLCLQAFVDQKPEKDVVRDAEDFLWHDSLK